MRYVMIAIGILVILQAACGAGGGDGTINEPASSPTPTTIHDVPGWRGVETAPGHFLWLDNAGQKACVFGCFLGQEYLACALVDGGHDIKFTGRACQ